MISFIIPAHNEEHLLGVTLQAVRAAASKLGAPYEVIVVDDASTDCTAAVAGELGAVVVSVTNRQIAATRNAGAQRSNGEVLIFVDADTTVDEEVVRAAIQAVRNGAVGGSAVAHSGTDAVRMLVGLVRHGRGFFKSRSGLHFWYRDRH